MGEDLIDNPQLKGAKDDLTHHIHNVFSLSYFKPILHVFKPSRL